MSWLSFLFGVVALRAFQAAWRYTFIHVTPDMHAHCEWCRGCLDADKRGVGSLDKLGICPECGDTAIMKRYKGRPLHPIVEARVTERKEVEIE